MSATDYENVRMRLFDAIQAAADGDEDIGESVLIGFLAVAEWQAPDGRRWLSKVAGDHSRSLPPWRQRGYAAEVLHDFWDEDGDAADGDSG